MNNLENAENSGANAPEADKPQRRKSRRATRPAMSPETPETKPASIDVIAELGDVEERSPAKASASKKKAAEKNQDLSLDDLVLPERDGEKAKQTASKPQPEEVQAKKPARKATQKSQPKSKNQTAERSEEEPRLPATALLFQAPEPVTARPRRTKPEREDSEKEKPAQDESSAVNKEQTPESDEGDRPRRRRRRGGRGRRRPTQGEQHDNGEDRNDQQDDEGQKSKEQQGQDRPKQEKQNQDKSSSQKQNQDRSKSDKRTPRKEESSADVSAETEDSGAEEGSSSRRRRRRTRPDGAQAARDQVTPLKGSTRLEAKRQRRRDGRDSRRRRVITEAEFLARRESVERKMYVREGEGRTQIAVLEDDILVEHYVAQKNQTSMVGNVYLGRVQNVLPSMEAAFVDIGRGRNAVLYAGEVNWDAAGLDGQPRRIEQALKSGDFVLVQVTKDPIGTKGARLTAQVTLAGRFLVLVPGGSMTGISRKLPESERSRLKKLLKDLVPQEQGVIVRTAAEGATEEQLKRDIERLSHQWAEIEKKQKKGATSPVLLKGEPELATRVVRDIFNEDFSELAISGKSAWKTLSEYVGSVAPDLAERLVQWTDKKDLFAEHRIDEQLTKGTDRKVYLPSGGSLVIDRTEAMSVVDVNTGKYTGSGGTLEETVTKNNLEAAEEIVRQLRLRDIGGIIVIDFIDMVLESNRELVLRRLVECLGRDRTRHQVAEVTSLGLVQMTRKRVGQGLVEAFSTLCECCNGRGFIVHNDPVAERTDSSSAKEQSNKKAEPAEEVKNTLQTIAAASSTSTEDE